MQYKMLKIKNQIKFRGENLRKINFWRRQFFTLLDFRNLLWISDSTQKSEDF